MSSTFPTPRLCPAELGAALELWALRREKVFEILDVRAARQARRLATSCKVLAEMQGAPLVGKSWEVEWRRTRTEALAMLIHAKLCESRRPAAQPVDLGGLIGRPPVDDAPLSARPTRVSGIPMAMGDDEQPTRIGQAVWNLERDEVLVA